MSAALNAQLARLPDSSIDTTNTDVYLGSVQSSFISPQKKPSKLPNATSSVTTATSSGPISTPSSGGVSFARRISEDQTPMPPRKNAEDTATDFDWDANFPDSPAPPKHKRTRSSVGAAVKGGVNLTLRDQEKVIDMIKKENFSLKFKVHFLEERLTQLAPDHLELALKQNINLKIEVHNLRHDLKKMRKLLLDQTNELEAMGKTGGRSRQLEEQLAEREQELRELRRRKGGVGADDVALREAEGRIEELSQQNHQLEEELDNARVLLQDNMEEIERLRDVMERRGEDSNADNEDHRTRLEKRVSELEVVNEDLRALVGEQKEAIAQRDEEREDLLDEIEGLRLTVEELQRRREAEMHERSQSRAEVLEERENREALEDDLNTVRDKLAATEIELQQRDDELEMRLREIEELEQEHDRIVEEVELRWREEADEARGQVEELRDALAERDTECKELRMQVAEHESNTAALHDKFEAAIAHLDQEAADRNAEIVAANAEIEKLSDRIWQLEEEGDQLRDHVQRRNEELGTERDVGAALKEKLSTLKSQLQEMTSLYESCRQDVLAHRNRQEELAQHVKELVEEAQAERDAREQAESDLMQMKRSRDEEHRRDRRLLEEKEAALKTAERELTQAKTLLTQRESDIADVQDALRAIEKESKKLGESHTTDRFSLELELDRLRRDLARCEDELERLRKELADREDKARERETNVDRLHVENRDLASQLAAQTQARLNLSEKLDLVQASLKATEGELSTFKTKVSELETRLSKDQRALITSENQYRDQLTERNTLLLTIYQYMDKILGADKSAKRGQSDMKPFTNFAVFHDNLISRLKALSQIQLDFDKRCKESEARLTERLTEVKKQLDFRWKQLDRFETSVKNLAEVKHTWRRKYSAKEGELEAVKATNAELSAQVSALRRVPNSEASELKALTARALNAERRLTNAQNQLASTEEKIASMNEKTNAADSKWDARVKEYESRLRHAEEKVKRERQGAKERINELETTVKSLERQIELAKKRNQQLSDVVDTQKAGSR